MNGGGPLAYEVKSTPRGDGQYRPSAHVVCRGPNCSATTSLNMTNAQNNPEWIGKQIRAQGWVFDSFHPGRSRCPTCIAANKDRRRGESPGPKPAPAASHPNGGATILTLPTATTPVPVPTVDQRAAIRKALEETFDEKLGCYIDGNSDQTLGTKLGLPWIMVRNLREAAYGPIKVVPELDQLRAEQTTLSERADTLLREATALDGLARALGARIDALARKFGIELAA